MKFPAWLNDIFEDHEQLEVMLKFSSKWKDWAGQIQTSLSSKPVGSTKLLLCMVLLLHAVAASAAGSVTFPGKISEAKSPNGLYTIKNFDYPEGNINYPNHVLFFLRKGQEKGLALNVRQLLLHVPGVGTYNRIAQILWSPDSSAFLLNDWEGSNIASLYLYRVRDLKHPVNLADKCGVQEARDVRRIVKSDHVYTYASKWISATAIEIKVTGHGSGGPFTFYFLLDLRKNSCKLIKREWKEDPSVPLMPNAE